MRTLVGVVVAALVSGCQCGGGGDGDGGTDGGRRDAGGTNDAFEIITLDADGGEPTWLAMAIEPTTRRIGVAYYAPRGTMINPGVPDYDLKYLEWNDGTLTAPQTIRYVQRKVGLSLQFQPTSREPAIAFLGGDDTFVPGMSIFWFQSDAVLATRNGATWTQTTVAQNSNDVDCGNPVSNNGFLVGLWPALAYDGAGNMVFVWRDGHDTTNMAWYGSDVESAEGTLTNFTRRCVNQGGNGGVDGKPAWGGRNQLAIGVNGEPALVYDRVQSGADNAGIQVWFQKRVGTSWTLAQRILDTNDTTTGASIAYDSTEGYAVAAVDAPSGGLRYVSSADGVTWNAPDEVFGSGSGGWYPSLAIDPATHDPHIAYYICSPRDGVPATSCQASDDELRVAGRTPGGWNSVLVDKEGGWNPKLGFFADGRRVIVYRDPRSGAVKLALERR
ncbi:MAG: hypothetical protein QM817_28685 [Archangium sp.]